MANYRQVISTSASRGTLLPALLGPTLWLYAAETYVTLIGGAVDVWRDRSGNGNDVTAPSSSDRPVWESSGGWSASKPSVFWNSAGELRSTAGSIIDQFTGSNKPFSAFSTLQMLTSPTNDQTICCWDISSGGTTLSHVRTDNTSGGKLRYVRTDAVGGSASNTGTVTLPSSGGSGSHARVGFTFPGTTISTFVEAALDINGGSASVGSLTINRFRLANGPGIDRLSGRMVELVVLPYAATAQDWNRYYTYSIGEWGA